jgi:sugar phosphate isomerase/epimerase
MRFGISTHLFHDVPLGREHLVDIASRRLDAIELFATRSHFDYHDREAIGRLDGWLTETGLELHSVHAPITTSLAGGVWGPTLSNASADPRARQVAVAETVAALEIARRIPFPFLVVHLGVPMSLAETAGINTLEAARRSLDEIHAVASPLGVRLALEVIPNALSSPDALVSLLEDGLDLPDVGLCLDYGHAFIMGDLVDAIESVAGHLLTTHVHDNGGRSDDHLLPFDGAIDWGAALMATQKVGYDGTLMFELAGAGSPHAVLDRTRHVRTRFNELII